MNRAIIRHMNKNKVLLFFVVFLLFVNGCAETHPVDNRPSSPAIDPHVVTDPKVLPMLVLSYHKKKGQWPDSLQELNTVANGKASAIREAKQRSYTFNRTGENLEVVLRSQSDTGITIVKYLFFTRKNKPAYVRISTHPSDSCSGPGGTPAAGAESRRRDEMTKDLEHQKKKILSETAVHDKAP